MADHLGMAAKFADDLHDEIIHRTGGDVPHGARRVPAILADVVAGVIEVGVAVLVLLAARLGREAIAADSAADQPLEQGLVGVTLLNGAADPSLAVEGVVGFLPQFCRDQRGMLGGVVLPLVVDHAFIQRIANDALDLVGDEPLATDELFPSPAGLDKALAGPQSLDVQGSGDFGRAAKLLGQFKDALGDGAFHGIGRDLLGNRVVGVAEGCPSAVPHAFLGAFGDLVGNALGDGLALELAEGKEHVEHEHSHRGAGVEALRGGDEVDLVLFQHLPKLVEVGQVAGDAVELVGDDDIDIAGADFPKEGLHTGAFEVLAGETRVVDEVGGGPSLVLVDGDGVLADAIRKRSKNPVSGVNSFACTNKTNRDCLPTTPYYQGFHFIRICFSVIHAEHGCRSNHCLR